MADIPAVCTGVILPYPTFLMLLGSCVLWVLGNVHAGRPVGLPESTVKLVTLQKWCLQGSSGWYTEFLHCVKVLCGVDHL